MSDKKSILMVAHNSIHSTVFGGVEVYLSQISGWLAKDYTVYCYVPDTEKHSGALYLYDSDGALVQTNIPTASFTNWQLRCSAREASFLGLLQEYQIDLVHFHHLAGHPPSLIKVAKQFGASVVFTLHDYFGLCHIANLINEKDNYCAPDQIPISDCDRCLQKKYGLEPGSQSNRRAYWNTLFSSIDSLIFNTAGGLRLASDIYPAIANHPNKTILPVAIEKKALLVHSKEVSQPLKVAILGNLSHHKGAETIITAINSLANEPIEFHFFGVVEEVYEKQLKAAQKKGAQNPRVFLYGKYPPGQIPPLVATCDVSLHVSILPETYGLTLSEAWTLGLVPIVTNIGALGERVSDGINGIKIPVGSSADLIKALQTLLSQPSKLANLRKPIADLPISWMPSHIADLSHLYQDLLQNPKVLKPHVGSAGQDGNGGGVNTLAENWACLPMPSSDKGAQPRARSLPSRIKGRLGAWLKRK